MDVAAAREILGSAFDSLRSQKGRVLLTVGTIAAGVGVVVSLSSVIAGLNGAVEQAFAGLDMSVVYVRAVREGESLSTAERQRRKLLTLREAQLLEDRCPSVEAVAAMQSRVVEVRTRDHETRRETALAASAEYAVVHEVVIMRGRFLSPHDAAVGRRVAVIGEELARQALGGVDVVGRTLQISGAGFRIVGVAARPKGIFGEVMRSKLFVPIGALEREGADADLYDVDVLGKPGTSPEQVADEIRRSLRQIRHLGPHEADTFATYGSELILGFYERTTRGVFVLLVATSSTGLVVGGIGLMNVMLLSVRQRTREIGIRRAVGARRRDVLAQFLLEATAMSLGGGAFGLLAGVAFAAVVRGFSPLPAAVQAHWVGAALLAAVGVGLSFGLWPAVRASRVDPILALRAE
jgi:putative ABC transport system permease protein